MMRLLGPVGVALLVFLSTVMAPQAYGMDACGSDSGSTLSGKAGSGSVGVSGACSVRPTDIPGGGGSPILIVDCGYATASNDQTHWNKDCGPNGFPCPAIPGDPYPHQFLTTLALTRPIVPIAQWCAGVNTPMPTAAALREAVIRLLTPPPLGVSPSTGTTLVNLRTLYWVDAPPTKLLGRAALIGFPVELRVNYLHTDFDFGDGTTASLAEPGTPYTAVADCGACTDRFGHTYLQPGTVTVTAHTYWQAQYRVAGQPWTAIPGPVTAVAPSTTTLKVLQARSELVSR
jgi:hypothetical protein